MVNFISEIYTTARAVEVVKFSKMLSVVKFEGFWVEFWLVVMVEGSVEVLSLSFDISSKPCSIPSNFPFKIKKQMMIVKKRIKIPM